MSGKTSGDQSQAGDYAQRGPGTKCSKVLGSGDQSAPPPKVSASPRLSPLRRPTAGLGRPSWQPSWRSLGKFQIVMFTWTSGVDMLVSRPSPRFRWLPQAQKLARSAPQALHAAQWQDPEP